MQWLINIIQEWIIAQGYLTAGYVHRGDPGAFDFVAVNFTKDNAWHDLDLSGIVPANARCANLYLVIRATAIHKQIQFRSKDVTAEINKSTNWTQVANIRIGYPTSVAVDSDRVIQYKVFDATFNLINFVVSGWWF